MKRPPQSKPRLPEIGDVRPASLLPAVTALALVAPMSVIDAHKPITSPFTYSADVLPIVRERCAPCHAPGGVAPMSLLTYQDAVPWGESMRLELTSGHMPPWSVDRGAGRFRNTESLSARELNVLLTWATGGTPPGEAIADTTPAPATATWPLGTPDTVVDLPAFTLGAEEMTGDAEFSIPGADADRLLRAIDILPGTAAMVRAATVEVEGKTAPGRFADERLLALWVPGDEPAPIARGALLVPAGAAMRVRMHYRRTWSYEGRTMTDRSRVGLYFAMAPAQPVRALPLSPVRPVTLPQTVRALAVYPDETLAGTGVVITATRPGGKRDELIAFHSRAGWARRFWFREPLTLPQGTVVSVRLSPDLPVLFPGVTKPPASTPSPSARVTLNVVP